MWQTHSVSLPPRKGGRYVQEGQGHDDSPPPFSSSSPPPVPRATHTLGFSWSRRTSLRTLIVVVRSDVFIIVAVLP